MNYNSLIKTIPLSLEVEIMLVLWQKTQFEEAPVIRLSKYTTKEANSKFKQITEMNLLLKSA